MPSPISHLVYAQQFLMSRPDVEEKPFLRGTIFPDIRLYLRWERSRTHWPHKVKLADVEAEPNGWHAGLLFHNWLDDVWVDYFSAYQAELRSPAPQLSPGAALKILEERSVRRRLAGMVDVAEALGEEADPEALDFGATKPEAVRWGELVADDLRGGWMGVGWQRFLEEGVHLDAVGRRGLEQWVNELDRQGVWEERLQEAWVMIEAQLGRSL